MPAGGPPAESVVTRPGNQPARTLLFVASGGHHGPGMNGLSNLVRMNEAQPKRRTLDTISVPGLERTARFYADFINEVATTPRTDLQP